MSSIYKNYGSTLLRTSSVMKEMSRGKLSAIENAIAEAKQV
jgi:hypothetical protein